VRWGSEPNARLSGREERYRGRGALQIKSVWRGQDENRNAGSMSPNLYKKRKGGPATSNFVSHKMRRRRLRLHESALFVFSIVVRSEAR
jgi:hypothetical protein